MEIVKIAQICRNFPSEPLKEIHRENQLDAIDKALSGAYQVVFVEGEQGIGKTALLSQFMKKHEGAAIGLFITPISRLAYSKDYINTVVVEQLHWLFESKRFPSETASSKDVQKMMLRLQKYSRTKPFYFIVDGLDEIDVNERDDVTRYIFQEVLQLGMREFRYVVSGNASTIKLPGTDRIQTQTHQIYPFDLYQIRQYFDKFLLKEEDILDLKAFSHGVPLRLEVALRWLEDGNTIEDLYTLKNSKAAELFELDWKRVDLSGRPQQIATAIATFASRPITLSKAIQFSGMTEDALVSFFVSSRLIEIETTNQVIRFRSEAQRQFAMKKLESLRSEIENLLLEDLITRSGESDSILYLLDDLANAGRHESVLQHLDNTHFANVLNKEQSLSVLKRHAATGCKAAQKLEKIPAVLQYGLSQSLIHQLDGSFTSRAEIRALLKLCRGEEAISIACAADTKENRFALLAAIGSHLVVEKANFPSELRDHISRVATSIDLATLGTRSSEIAEDLVAFDPDLAFKVLSASSNSGKHANNDIRFAQFHMAVSNSSIGAPAKELAQKRARDQITSTKIQDFTDAASALLSKYDATQIISRAERLEGQHRVDFLKTWLLQNSDAEDAADVAENALSVMLARKEHTPKLSDFREIAAVLPNMKDRIRAKAIAQSIESQKSVVPNHGTSEEYVRLQMTLLQSEAVSEIEKAKERAIDLYSEVDDLKDVGTKTACLAWMLHYMHDIKNLSVIDADTNILASIASQLIDAFDTLLLSTADHYSIAKRPIEALAKYYPDKAFDLAGRLNTQERRNKGYVRLIAAQLRSKAYQVDCTYLHKSVMEISTANLRDHTIMDIMQAFRRDVDFNLAAPKADATLNLWREVKGPEARFLSILDVYLTLKDKDVKQAENLEIEKNLDLLWDAMPAGWYKVHSGYKAINRTALVERALAERWLGRVREESDATIATSEDLNKIILAMTFLAIRSAAGLIRMKKMSGLFWTRLCRLICSVAGPEQVSLWTDLALRCAFKGDLARCQEIVNTYILPTINNVDRAHSTLRSYLIFEAAPALYLHHANSADEYISSISIAEQDDARGRVCDCLLSQLSPYEPAPDQLPVEFLLDYNRSIDICVVLEKIGMDAIIFSIVSTISDSLISKKNRTSMTLSQKKAVIDRLEKIIERRLPDKNNIQHDGFKIACKAKLLRVKSTVQTVKLPDWQALRDDANQIANVADRAIVICIVAVQASTQNLAQARSWIGEARVFANSISSQMDRIDRFRWMAELVGKIDPGFCQSVVKEAFELTNSLEESEYSAIRHRQLLDLAHQHDPKLADNLIELMDKDPARREAKVGLNSHVKVLKARKKVFDRESSQFETLDDHELHEVTSRNLSSLVYGRYATCHMNEMIPLLERASTLPMSETIAMWNFFIENVNQRFENVQQETFVMPDIFESVLNAAELASTLVGRTKKIGKNGEASTTLFRDGERDAAYDAIRKWISSDVESDLLISDPYFGPDELELIKMVQELRPTVRIRLLGSSEHVKKYQIDGKSLEDTFKDKWFEISDQDPPRTDITLAALKTNRKHPIHDRWFVSGDSGLRVGTSVNAIGIGRTSEISRLTKEEAIERGIEILTHINRDSRDKVSYSVVDL